MAVSHAGGGEGAWVFMARLSLARTMRVIASACPTQVVHAGANASVRREFTAVLILMYLWQVAHTVTQFLLASYSSDRASCRVCIYSAVC